MRLLHAGLRHVALRRCGCATPIPADAADREGAAGQSLPLHRLRADHPRRARRSRAMASRRAIRWRPSATRSRRGLQALQRRRARRDRRGRATGSIVPADRRRSRRGLRGQSDGARIVAGATDVGLWVTKFMRDIGPVIFIGHLAGAAAHRGGRRRHHASAPASPTPRPRRRCRRAFPRSGRLWDRIGGEQVRNMGTIGGNIANGSPIGDTPPPLIALGATRDAAQGRRAARDAARGLLHRLWQAGPAAGRVRRERHVPVPAGGEQFAVYKISKRRDEDISALCGAFRSALDDDGKVGDGPHRLWRHGGDAEARQRPSRRRWSASRGREATVEAAMPAFATDLPAAHRHARHGRVPAAGGAEPAAALLPRDHRHRGSRSRSRARGGMA